MEPFGSFGMYDWSHIELATLILAAMPAVIVTAVAAYMTGRRLVFFAGMGGVVFASFGTGVFLTIGRSTGGLLDNLNLAAEAVFQNTVISSTVAIGIALVCSLIMHTNDHKQ